MVQSSQSILKKQSLLFFKDHIVMVFVTLLLMAIMVSDEPWMQYTFFSFVTVVYGFLLFSDSLIAARRDFYNANGNLSLVDLKLGFKAGFWAQLPTFIVILGHGVWYVYCLITNTVASYTEVVIYLWQFPFMGFFPDATTNPLLAFLLCTVFAFFPCVAAGISYIYGIRQCKTKN